MELRNHLHFGLARVSAARTFQAVRTLISPFTFTLIALADPSAIANTIVYGTAGLVRGLALTGRAFKARITFTFSTLASTFSCE